MKNVIGEQSSKLYFSQVIIYIKNNDLPLKPSNMLITDTHVVYINLPEGLNEVISEILGLLL